MKRLFIISLIFVSTSALAFKNEDYKISSPDGWFEKPGYMGTDVSYLSPYKPNRKQPVLLMMTHEKTKDFKNTKEFLLRQVELHKKNFREKTKNNSYRLVSEGSIKSKGHFAKVEFVRGNEKFYEYMALFPNKQKVHVFLFSSPKDYFLDYWEDISKTLKSFETID